MDKKYIMHDSINGYTLYYKDPEQTILHREDGPAVIDENGCMWWYLNGEPELDSDGQPKYREGNYN